MTMHYMKAIILALLLISPASYATEPPAPDPDIPLLILFDRSASMQELLDGEPRIEVATRFFKSWSQSIAGRENVTFRFFAGGINKDDDTENCLATQSVIPLGNKATARELDALLDGLKPLGRKTNLAYALLQAKDDLSGTSKGRIVLISDGLENCDTDPTPIAKTLGELGFNIDVIGIGKAEDIAGLGKIALVSGGQFSIAGSASQLSNQLSQQLPDFKLPDFPNVSDSDEAASPLITVIETTEVPTVTPAPAIAPLELKSPEVSDIQAKPVAIELVLDVSGSMAGRISRESKMMIARDALTQTLTGLDDPIFKVGLRAYGFDHSLPKTKQGSCPNTELLTPISANNLRRIKRLAYNLEPYGYTPIAKSLMLAGEDLKKVDADNRMIILITDGEETCDGDPIETARSLCAMGINMETHIIGFDLEPATAAEMKQAAEAGCGSYLDAQNARELVAALQEVVATAQDKIDPTWLRTIRPVEGGKSPETAVELSQGTYTLTRALEKGEQIYFRVDTDIAQHALLRGLIQQKRLIRNENDIAESKYGLAQFNITLYPPDDKKKRGRSVRLSGEPGTFKSIGYLDTYGDGILFSIGSKYDRVHADSLFNLEIREAGDLYEGHEAPSEFDPDSTVTVLADKAITGHLGEGDFVDLLKLPAGAHSGSITMKNESFAYRYSLIDNAGKRLLRARAKGQESFKIPTHSGPLYLQIEDKNPTLKQIFTPYEVMIHVSQ